MKLPNLPTVLLAALASFVALLGSPAVTAAQQSYSACCDVPADQVVGACWVECSIVPSGGCPPGFHLKTDCAEAPTQNISMEEVSTRMTDERRGELFYGAMLSNLETAGHQTGAEAIAAAARNAYVGEETDSARVTAALEAARQELPSHVAPNYLAGQSSVPNPEYAPYRNDLSAAVNAGHDAVTTAIANDTSAAAASIDAELPQGSVSKPAGAGSVTKTYTLYNPLSGVSDLRVVIGRLGNMLVAVSGSVALLMFVYGGILLIASGGDKGRIERGRGIFIWTTVGLVIIFSAQAIITAIINIMTTGRLSG
jgi:hypothetical protein